MSGAGVGRCPESAPGALAASAAVPTREPLPGSGTDPHLSRPGRGQTLHRPTAAQAESATAPSWRGLPLTAIFSRIRHRVPQPARTPERWTLWRIDREHGDHCPRLAARVKL